MKLFVQMVLLLAVLFLVALPAEAATQTPRSQSGTFTGANNPTITVGGNCPPINVRLKVTGICEGLVPKSGDCSRLPTSEGYFQRHEIDSSCVYAVGCMCGGGCSTSASFTTGESCSASGRDCSRRDGCCAYGNCGRPRASCTATSYINQEGKPANCNGEARTYYKPCTKDPQVSVNGGTWKYSGLVKDTSTVSISIGTNSNPPSSPSGYVGVKVPTGNFKLGGNALALSASAVNKFNYVVEWTEETAPGGGDADGDGYYSSQCTLGNDCNDNDPNVNPGRLEVPGNGKDDNCDGAVDVLYINSMADITKYCPYNSATRTYSCTGWENIYVQNDLGMPNINCWYTRACRSDGQFGGCDATNIVIKANNEFSARNFYASNGGGPGGSIAIEAKKITATSLNTYGSTCTDSQCSCGGPFCGSNTGGPVTLTGDTIDIGTINANDGAGRGGSGGTISVSGNTTRIGIVYSQGAGYSCSYNYGYTNGAGSGGSVRIKSGSANIGTIYLNGAGGSYADSGGSGGSARLEAGDLTLGSISATGGYRNGGGGSVTMLSSKAAVSGTVSVAGYASGADGAIKIGSDSISSQTITTRGSNSGGSAKVYIDTYTIPSLSSSYVSFVTNNTPQNRAFISAGTLVFGPRTKGAIIGFSTSIPDTSAKSFQLRMKDLSGAYVRSFGQEWHEEGTITQAGKVSKEIGRDFPLSGFNSGKKYILALTTSRDQVFDQARCSSGAASCNSYEVGFVEWT